MWGKVLILIVGGLFFVRLAESSAVKKDKLEESFSYNKVKSLRVENISGLVRFQGDKSAKSVDLKVEKINWEKSCRLKVKQDKEEVFVKLEKSKSSFLSFSEPNCVANVIVKAPEKMELNLRTASGDLKVSGAVGKVKLKSSSGSAFVKNVEGEFKAHLGSGNLKLSSSKGDVKFSTGSGNISLTEVKGNCQLESGSGEVKIQKLEGKASIKTHSGDLVVEDSDIKDLRVRLGSGDSRLKGKFVCLDLKSGSGDIKVFFLNAPEKGETSLKSGSGNISLSFPKEMKAGFSVKTRSGSLTQGIASFKKASYEVKLESGSGDLKILAIK